MRALGIYRTSVRRRRYEEYMRVVGRAIPAGHSAGSGASTAGRSPYQGGGDTAPHLQAGPRTIRCDAFLCQIGASTQLAHRREARACIWTAAAPGGCPHAVWGRWPADRARHARPLNLCTKP